MGKGRAAANAVPNKKLVPPRLNIFCAGVSLRLVTEIAGKWNRLHPELPARITSKSSIDLIRQCISGDPCDLLISADDVIIRSMMLPEYVSGYRIWAGNKIVISGEDISSKNWVEKITASDATFKHHNPYGDPGGYRAVMAMLLADFYIPGLADRLMNHPGHFGMERDPKPSTDLPQTRYEFVYYSGAKMSGKNFAELPPIMDLSDPALAKEYARISFAVDDQNTVTATPIAHALTIPRASIHRMAAKEFAKMFLATDKETRGFLVREDIFGEDPVKEQS